MLIHQASHGRRGVGHWCWGAKLPAKEMNTFPAKIEDPLWDVEFTLSWKEDGVRYASCHTESETRAWAACAHLHGSQPPPHSQTQCMWDMHRAELSVCSRRDGLGFVWTIKTEKGFCRAVPKIELAILQLQMSILQQPERCLEECKGPVSQSKVRPKVKGWCRTRGLQREGSKGRGGKGSTVF